MKVVVSVCISLEKKYEATESNNTLTRIYQSRSPLIQFSRIIYQRSVGIYSASLYFFILRFCQTERMISQRSWLLSRGLGERNGSEI